MPPLREDDARSEGWIGGRQRVKAFPDMFYLGDPKEEAALDSNKHGRGPGFLLGFLAASPFDSRVHKRF